MLRILTVGRVSRGDCTTGSNPSAGMLRILTYAILGYVKALEVFQSLSRDVEDSDNDALNQRQALLSSNPSAGMLRILTGRP